MLENIEDFNKRMRELDIHVGDYIVCYDKLGAFSSPRAWFNFQIYGAENVYVLDGGFPKWESENLPIQKGKYEKVKLIIKLNQGNNIEGSQVIQRQSLIEFSIRPGKVLDLKDVLKCAQANQSNAIELIDCRSEPRFKAEVDEPRPVKRKGNIKTSKNVFCRNLLDNKNCFKKNDEIKKEFEKKNVDINKPIICYCGSGITACVNIFALNLLGKYDDVKLYDGSWAEMVIS